MHSLLNSLRKRVYTLRLNSKRCAREWSGRYWSEEQGVRTVHCTSCPKFSAAKAQCSVPFGSPLRKCISAAQEAHLHSLGGRQLLEIGFGKHSIPRQLVTSAGGTWTGIEPMMSSREKAEVGKGGFGHVTDIPFPDATFDVVVGIQTLEHWAEPLPDASLAVGHARSLREVHRVLKPGGSIYFDAPIHLHGHEMFVAGDVDRIRGLFAPEYWRDVTVETWRDHYAPLDRYQTPDADRRGWAQSVTSYPDELLEDIVANRSVWLITISATKAPLSSEPHNALERHHA